MYIEAKAAGRIRLKPSTLALIRKGALEKGDPLAIASVAAIAAVKSTPSIIALAHPLKVERSEPVIKLGRDWVEVTMTVSAHEKTGVEMEALTAVSVALLNIWDVTKSHEKDADGQYPSTAIEWIRVTSKVNRANAAS